MKKEGKTWKLTSAPDTSDLPKDAAAKETYNTVTRYPRNVKVGDVVLCRDRKWRTVNAATIKYKGTQHQLVRLSFGMENGIRIREDHPYSGTQLVNVREPKKRALPVPTLPKKFDPLDI